MKTLDKVASACAGVFLKRAMIPSSASKVMQNGDSMRTALLNYSKAQQRAANAGSMPDWLKMILGVGGGSVVLDKVKDNNDQSDWRR